MARLIEAHARPPPGPPDDQLAVETEGEDEDDVPASRQPFHYQYHAGFLALGGDLGTVVASSNAQAFAACTALITCRGLTFNNSAGGVNGTITAPTKVILPTWTLRNR